MSKIKAGGSSKNVHDSPGQRLGVKVFGGQPVKTGDIIVRQVGMSKRAGEGTFMSKNFTIHATRDGVVKFTSRKFKSFSGRSVPRTEVRVE
ncbi:50S ribosomal protein L27 [Candidatus Saccharibacteria bacterium RIFCSPLOWO2_01_FULL_48_13]|nr:MAG: 50S ribosomal protein L27 [Candidatus Saccharibacteria bacterium RIFCSPLOWO2_01_FULL_48_13]